MRAPNLRQSVTREQLAALVHDEGLSDRRIGMRLGYSHAAVTRARNAWAIPSATAAGSLVPALPARYDCPVRREALGAVAAAMAGRGFEDAPGRALERPNIRPPQRHPEPILVDRPGGRPL